MKKLPLVFSGCLLGLAGAGNLILDTLPVLSHILSLSGLVLWIFFLILHLFNWKETKQELTKPPLLSGMATFPMAGMILSTYVFRVFPHLPLCRDSSSSLDLSSGRHYRDCLCDLEFWVSPNLLSLSPYL